MWTTKSCGSLLKWNFMVCGNNPGLYLRIYSLLHMLSCMQWAFISSRILTYLRCDLWWLTEFLSFYKFSGHEIPIVRGSALLALQGTNEEIGKKLILKLMEVVDEYIPDPKCVLEKPFLMPIEDVFSIQVFFFGNIGQLHLLIYSANM